VTNVKTIKICLEFARRVSEIYDSYFDYLSVNYKLFK